MKLKMGKMGAGARPLKLKMGKMGVARARRASAPTSTRARANA